MCKKFKDSADLSMKNICLSDHVKSFLDHIASEIPTLNLPINKIILYGSQAKGTAKITSDIDLAIVSAVILNRRQRADLIGFLDEYDSLVHYDLFWTSEENLRTDNQFEANYWIAREGVTVYEK